MYLIIADLAEPTTSWETRQAAERKLQAEEQALQAQLLRRQQGPAAVVDPNS
jgi:hypothetical protein